MQEPATSRSSDAEQTSGGIVVVGIGDRSPDHYSAALRLAAQLCRQRQAELRLVHGCLPRLSIALRDEALERHLVQGRKVLAEAERTLSSMFDQDIPISLAAVPRAAVDALLHEARTAAVLVVQRRLLSTVGHLLSGATSDTVAAQAACPVIAVRHDHIDGDEQRGVVVGIGTHSGLRALNVGIAEASARRCPLTAVHVWDLQFSPTFGGWVDPDGEELAAASKWADSVLADAVNAVAKSHPDVEVHARSVKGVTEDGLLAECEQAELLVVERHRDAHLASIGLGTLTRHLLDHAPCPVMVTPHSDAGDHPAST
jgi:nucleotide-binding universal stress UspA family protein